jgi:AmmeMemoRadiSam system protein B/AmmeMemoRadiSam system protein A
MNAGAIKPGAIVLLSLLLILCACRGSKSEGDPTMQHAVSSQDIRRPAVAGSWYSSDSLELKDQLENYLSEAQDFKLPEIIGLVSPHAGYIYSGPVAAYAYRQIEGRHYDVVVVVAPSHVEAFPFAAVYGRGAYQTPFGQIPVEVELALRLTEGHKRVKISDKGHRQETQSRQEHSLEMQLPFLQIALGDFKLVPIVMGDQSDSVINDLAASLAHALKGKKALLVASSDLSHFHPYDEANRLDSALNRRLADYNSQAFLTDLRYEKVEACGGGPICAVMEACRLLGANRSRLLKYANSGDVTGDRSRVVGYTAAAFYVDPVGETKKISQALHRDTTLISPEDRQALLRIARATIEAVVRGERVPAFEATSPLLLEDRGAFVTIHKKEDLRGCIGYIIGVKPLYQTVCEVAEAAALRDPRFDPVLPAELPDLHLEISALSIPRRVSDISEIQVGTHGIIIRRGYRQGLLLPQVATEYGWDRKTFLEHTCRKAGLPINAWQDEETEIEIFSAEVFGEK